MKRQGKTEIITKTSEKAWDLMLYNDSENSMQYVITTLIVCCNHGLYQAEQCAIIAHHKGQCSVKRGDYKSLLDLSFEMKARNLKTEII